MIVQSSTHQLFIIQGEPQWLHEVQRGTGIGAEADDVAGIRGNFRLIEDDMEHDEDLSVWLMA